MRNRTPIVAALLAITLGLAATASAQEKTETYEAAARGFGDVKVTLQDFSDQKQKSSWTRFDCEDAAHAELTASKRMADLLGFGDIKKSKDSDFAGILLELPGAGYWLLGTDGNLFYEFFASDKKQLKKLIAEAKIAKLQAVPERAYPRWLDCFDNAGPGIWFGGGGAPVDIDAEFPWMKERGLTYNFHPPKEAQYLAPGVFDTSLTDWFGAMAKKYDIPFRTNYWEIAKPSWYWNRTPLPYVKSTPGHLSSKFEFEREVQGRIPYGSEPISASNPFTHDARMRFMASIKDDPNFLGTMGVAEIGKSGVRFLPPIAEMPETRAYWQSYLVTELGFDLPKLGLAHHSQRDYYKDWSEVEVPITRDFMGFDGESIDLTGKGWEGVADYDIEKYAEHAKAGSAPAPKAIPTKGWVPVASNDPLLLTYKGKQHSKVKFADYWLRRDFNVTKKQLPELKYLQIERPGWRSKYCDAYLNGKPLKQITRDRAEEMTVCFELGDKLRAGKNKLVLRMEGCPPIGFVTLGKLPLRPYPEMSKPENRRWYDASNFVTWLRMRGVEQILQAARTVEPNRPLKMMALINHMDMAIPLAKRYGAYIHDTGGASGYWCPFTGAKIARAHGLPWSIEQGGPPRNATDFQGHIGFNIMYGNDAVDLVFATTHYKGTPGVGEWFDKNLELIKTFGKMHQPKQDIAMLFSARNLRLGFNEMMNWHFGRGALQQAGRNFVQIETSDIGTEIMDEYPVIIDCGTVVMTQQEVDAIHRYVEKGGIFVAQHHTARNLPAEADVWPLAKSLGLKVTPKWMTKENYHRWKLAKIKLSEDQELLPSLKGKTVEGSGVAIDWLGNENSGAVAYTKGDKSKAKIKAVATWVEDGSMAIVEAPLGRGKIILLGTPLFTRMRDESGIWVNAEEKTRLFDEFLTSLGVKRDSWVKNTWAEIWRSKNGVYDLYKVARIGRKGDEKITETPRIRREEKVEELVEVSALGHPKVKVTWKDGVMTLPEEEWGKMKARVYLAPAKDIARAGLDWYKAQSMIWRELPPLQDTAKPQAIPIPDDVIPAINDWKMSLDQQDEEWIKPGADLSAWKDVKLGSFAAMGIPEDAKACFRKTIEIPADWQGRRINLKFSATWSYGVINQGKLWINGELAKVRQPLRPGGHANFTLDISEQAKNGKIELALEVDGKWKKPRRKLRLGEGRPRPSGVTGVFFLEAIPATVATTPLNGPWFAAGDVGVLTTVKKGEKVTYTYLETKFKLPKKWPGKRLFLERPDRDVIQHIILNNKAVTVPMPRIDISKLVKKNGENVLRWVPGHYRVPEITRKQTMVIPDLNLVWTKGE